MKVVEKRSSSIIQTLIKNALDSRATDIHIEPSNNVISVRYRVDGLLQNPAKLPNIDMASVVDDLKTAAGLDTLEVRVPQSGRFDQNIDGQSVNLRVSTLPVIRGERVVAHLENEASRPKTLADLGLWGEGLTKIEKALQQPHGLIIVTGPVNSGKTTTLYTLLQSINNPSVHIGTVEEQIQHRITGVSQTLCGQRTGPTIAEAIKALINQDTNIIMVDDVKDEIAIKAIVEASHSHLVIAGVSAKDPTSCVSLLINLRVEPHVLASVLRVIVGQRLVRKIDQKVFTQYKPDEQEVEQLERDFVIESDDKWNKILDAVSKINHINQSTSKDKLLLCKPKSEKPEYTGRIGIFEVLNNSTDIEKMIVALAHPDTLKTQAVAEGMISMKLDGLIKAIAGLTTIPEVLKAVQT